MDPVLLNWVGVVPRSVRSLLGPLGVALHTQDFTIQRKAAVFICFYGEGPSTVLQQTHDRKWQFRENDTRR